MRITVYRSQISWSGDLNALQERAGTLKDCISEWNINAFRLQKQSTERYEFIYPLVRGVFQGEVVTLEYSYSLLSFSVFLFLAVVVPILLPVLLLSGDDLITTLIALSSVLLPISLLYFGGAVVYMHRLIKNKLFDLD